MRADEHLSGVSTDLDLAMGHRGSRSEWSLYSAKTTKRLALEHVEGCLNGDAEDDPEADAFVLRYSGHGAGGTGDWCVANGGRVSFGEVMALWEASRARSRGCLLVLVLDSCHSGVWIERARSGPYPTRRCSTSTVQYGWTSYCTDTVLVWDIFLWEQRRMLGGE